MAHMMWEGSGVNVEEEISQNTNQIPTEVNFPPFYQPFLPQILSHLPQNHVVLCREVCPHWRDVIDLHCPMKDVIVLKPKDRHLYRKLELRMTSCVLHFFHKNTSNISLSYPQTIKSFTFSDQGWHDYHYVGYDEMVLNIANARGLLFQIEPFVECLKFETRSFQHDILYARYLFPKLRELEVRRDLLPRNGMNHNLEILFSYRLPVLKSLHLYLTCQEEKLMDERYVNFFNFLANHRHTVKQLVLQILYDDGRNNFFHLTREFDVAQKVIETLSKGELQLESLELHLPPKYLNTWAPITKSQKKLIHLTIGNCGAITCPEGVKFYTFAPGIYSSISTLRTVSLSGISSVGKDGMTWIPLDVSLLGEAVNLTLLELTLNFTSQTGHDRAGTPKPNKKDGAEIINLQEINSTSLKWLRIWHFVCNSGELQSLVENAPILEVLNLFSVMAPTTSSKFAETGVHGGIVKSFFDKETKKKIIVSGPLNDEHEDQNEKLEALRKVFPELLRGDQLFFRGFYCTFV